MALGVVIVLLGTFGLGRSVYGVRQLWDMGGYFRRALVAAAVASCAALLTGFLVWGKTAQPAKAATAAPHVRIVLAPGNTAKPLAAPSPHHSKLHHHKNVL